jgi:PAS domain S-box-containing protein
MGPFDEVGALDAAQDGSLPSAEQARLLAEYCPGAVFQAVGDAVRWISPSLPTVLGWSPEDVIGAPIDHLVHRDDGDALLGLRRSISAGESAHAVLRMLAKDDTYRSVEVWAHPYVSSDGLAGSVGSFVDVSERVAERDARTAAERQLRLISDHSFDVLYTTGEDERVTWVSSSVSRILGWTPEDLVGTVVADLVHPADHAAAGRLADGVLLRLRRRDGSYRWVAATASAATEAEGATAGPVGAFVDVDELVRTRDASRREAARELAILDTLMDPRAVLVAVRDAAGRVVDFEITEVNDVLRAEEGDLVGRRIGDLAPWIVTSGLIGRAAGRWRGTNPSCSTPSRCRRPERRDPLAISTCGSCGSRTASA